jgi:hypothetical protein
MQGRLDCCGRRCEVLDLQGAADVEVDAVKSSVDLVETWGAVGAAYTSARLPVSLELCC